MVTLDPLALSDPDLLDVLPTVTVPKFSEVGVIASCPRAVPAPERLIERFGLVAFETTEILPFALPVPAGENDAENVTLCPGASVEGKESPLIANPAPVTVACEMMTLEPPEFVRVCDTLCLLPTCTDPKFSLAGFAESVLPVDVPVPDKVTVRILEPGPFTGTKVNNPLPSTMPET